MRWLLLVVLGLAGCVDISNDLRNDQQQTSPTGGGTVPGPSPTPTPKPVASVAVGYTAREGLNCDVPPNLLIGCKAFVTCTPRDASGVDVGPLYVPAWDTLGPIAFDTTTINFYNGRAECSAPGQAAISCTVGEKTGVYQLTCTGVVVR
jgi:hypothetical protein